MSEIVECLGNRKVCSPPDPNAKTAFDLSTKQEARIVGICSDASAAITRRLFDLGFAPGAVITKVRKAPLGDPVVYRVAGVEVALRRDQARCIKVVA